MTSDQAPTIEAVCSATWESLYRFVYYKVQNREEAEDITQETYVKAYPHLRGGKVDPDKYDSFLRKVAHNIMRDAWRKQKRRGTTVDIDKMELQDISAENPAETSVSRHFIEYALRMLPPEQRKVIELRIIEGRSVADTAQLLDKQETAVRVMQHRALQFLAQMLRPQT